MTGERFSGRFPPCNPQDKGRQKEIGHHASQKPRHQVRHVGMQYEPAKKVPETEHGDHAEAHPRIRQRRTVMIDFLKFL